MAAPERRRFPADERRQALLEIAVGLCAERGLDAVGIGDVAEAAGVTRGLVHHYFGSQARLRLAVVRHAVSQTPTAVRTDLDLPIEEIVSRNYDAWLDHVEANRAILSVLWTQAAADEALDEVLDAAREDAVDRMLLNHLGTVDVPDSVRLLLRTQTAMSVAAAREWLWYGRATREQVHALLVHSLLALVRDVAPRLVAADGTERERPAKR